MMREFLPQLTLTATVKENAAGGETLSFIIPMGPLQVICIANIPGEGEREAPAYVKFKLDTRDTQNWLNNRAARGPRPRFNGDRDDRDDRDDDRRPPRRGRYRDEDPESYESDYQD
jgi:hypothetical protein